MNNRLIAAVLLIPIFVLLCLSLAPALPALAQAQGATTSPATFFYGIRLQSNMLLYVVAGVQFPAVDVGAGLGFNDGVWLGLHTYFYEEGEIGVFTGFELNVLYPPNAPLELHPALPIGFAVEREKAKFILSTMLEPVVPRMEVSTSFAFSFTMEL